MQPDGTVFAVQPDGTVFAVPLEARALFQNAGLVSSVFPEYCLLRFFELRSRRVGSQKQDFTLKILQKATSRRNRLLVNSASNLGVFSEGFGRNGVDVRCLGGRLENWGSGS